MVQALPTPISFDEFLAWYPDPTDRRYELHRGVIVDMPKPKGKHSDIAGFIGGRLFMEITRLGLSAMIPRECIVKAADGLSGYEPDVVVLDRAALADEPLWEKSSVISLGRSVRLAVEVVSTNWQDDYLLKLGDYERLGIEEYWVVDYLGLGGRLHIGYPKRPTLSVYHLVGGEYDVERFTDCQIVRSPAFPDLGLTAAQWFEPGV